MQGNEVVEEARRAMEKSLESLHRDLAKIRTGRANPVLLEGVPVDYYGNPTPLKQLATINAPKPRLLVVQPFDPGAIAAIEKAIMKADLGFSPSSDGKLVRVPIPELTEERRREFVKAVKKMGEEHRVGVRSGRRDAIAKLKELESSSDLSEDESRRAQKQTQDLTDASIRKVDEAISAKEEEVLRI